jgi:hypothetical protein
MTCHIQREELDDNVRRRDERAGRFLSRRERAGRPIPWEKPKATGLMQDGDPAQLVLQPRVAHPGDSVGGIAIASGAEPRKAGKRRPAGNVADASRCAVAHVAVGLLGRLFSRKFPCCLPWPSPRKLHPRVRLRPKTRRRRRRLLLARPCSARRVAARASAHGARTSISTLSRRRWRRRVRKSV